jgi:DNA-binding response OmpR family regulator
MAARIANQRMQESLLAKRKVLLVDEDSRDLQYYASLLKNLGFEVQTCDSYGAGARCLERETFDFVVVSQGSRAFEGRTVLERVVSIDRHIPVLILTRSVEMACYLDAMQLGAVDYLEKPLGPTEFAHVVTTHLRSQVAAA